jgi:hypothetical protein
MVAPTLVDLVKVLASTTGTGPITLGSNVPAFRGVEALVDGNTYSYSIQQEDNYEYGNGVYSSAGNVLTRGVEASSYGGSPIPLRVGAVVTFVALAASVAGGLPGIQGEPGAPGAPGDPGEPGPPTLQFPIFFSYTPGEDELLWRYTVPEGGDFTFPANFSSPDAHAGEPDTLPTATFVLTLQRRVGGSGAFATIGTLSVSTAGVTTFATTGGVAITVAEADTLRCLAPAVGDATIAGYSATLKGF